MRTPSLLGILLVAASSPAFSQDHSAWTVGLVIGQSDYDLAGTGTTNIVAAHFSWQVRPALIVEPGLTYFQYRQGGPSGPRATILFPEVSAQLIVPRGALRPYIGAGFGRTIQTSPDRFDSRSLHAVAGLRVEPRGGLWGFRGELRVRSPQQWGSVTADYTFGITRRLH
jgi:hypothetical protein